MNTTKTNKKLAEFLGWEFEEISETYQTPFLELVEPQAFGDEQFSSNLKEFELKFHNDWNWLMLLVNTIEELGYCVDIKLEYCRIVPQGKPNEHIVKFGEGNNKIEVVHNACSMFVDWYNETSGGQNK